MPPYPPPTMIETEADGTEGTPDDTSGGTHPGQEPTQVPDVDTVNSMYANGEIEDEQEFERLLERAIQTHGMDTEQTDTAAKRDALWWLTAGGLAGAMVGVVTAGVIHFYRPGKEPVAMLLTLTIWGVCMLVVFGATLLRAFRDPDHPLGAE